jgi:uncharacterized damage-inducible protein DinB
MLNPYATCLGNRSALEVLPTTSSKLHAILEQLGSKGVEQAPAPGKWSAREIVSHLADCEIAFGFRLRQTLAEDNHVLQPFDQEKWAVNYAAYEAGAALSAFAALRQWNLALIKSIPSEEQTKSVTHPERGTMTFLTIVETMAGHDLNHLQQLEKLQQQSSPA